MPRPFRRHSTRSVPAVIGQVQAAEPRVMLSGNVAVSFDADGLLTIQADQASNDLRIGLSNAGEVTFESDTTTVNGQAAGDVTIDIPDGGVRGIEVILGGGQDVIEIVGADGGAAGVQQAITGDVLIRAGGGADDVSLSNLNVNGSVRVVGGPGNDVLSVMNVNAEEISIEGGRGDDVLALDDLQGTVELVVYGGRGSDTIVGRDLRVTSQSDTPRLYGGYDEDTVAVEDDPSTILARGNRGTTATDQGPSLVIVEDGLDSSGEENEVERDSLDAVYAFAGERAGRDLMGVERSGLLSPTDDGEPTEFDDAFPAFDLSEFTRSDSGLLYRIIDEGTGEGATGTDDVRLNYQLFLSDGSAVEGNDTFSSGNPASFGVDGVIDGFAEALGLVGEDGVIQILVPPHIGYGANGSGASIPGDATLLFNIEVLEITRST